MTNSTVGAGALLLAAGLALAGLTLAASGAGAQQEAQPQAQPQAEILRPGPMLLGGAAGLPGAGQEEMEPEQDGSAEAHAGMAGHGGAADAESPPEQEAGAAPAGPAEAAFEAAMERMHQDMMAVATTGDPDVDFARAMIPHHQGAIDMAKAVIAHGKDPEIKRLAGEVVSAQEREIAQMNEWLLRQGR